MAVERVREDETVTEEIAAYGRNRTTINKWLKGALRQGLGCRVRHRAKAIVRAHRLARMPMLRRFDGRDDQRYPGPEPAAYRSG